MLSQTEVLSAVTMNTDVFSYANPCSLV